MDLSVPGARFVVARLPRAGEDRVLPAADAAHARARRLSPGDPVVLVDGSGHEAAGEIVRLRRDALEVRVASVSEAAADSLPPIHLFVAAVRAERLAWIAEKATELGAASLTLLVSERTQRQRAASATAARLSRVVEEAAKQAERARWPRIDGPVSFSQVLRRTQIGHRLLLDPRGEPFPARLAGAPTALLIGPEGGWSDAEHQEGLDAGWIAASLSAGKLRAETAAVAALALARAALSRGVD